jgi:hypothetical protein
VTARVCYVKRVGRGGTIAGASLVGPTGVECFPPLGSLATPSPDDVAAFVRDALAKVRGGTTLAMLCLDADGAAASWIATPTREVDAVASLVRMGGDSPASGLGGAPDAGRASPLAFFAADPFASLVQPLAETRDRRAGAANGRAGAAKGEGGSGSGSSGILSRVRPGNRATAAKGADLERVGVLAMVDAPARVLIDALDQQGVPVDTVTSVWHALARALDPSPEAADPEHVPLVALVTCERDGRVLWAWSRAGQLVAAGSVRAVVVPASASARDDDDPEAAGDASSHVALGADEAARITNDWLAWSAQLCAAPARIVALLPLGHDDGESSRRFAMALGASWHDATVDAATDPDPIHALLTRLARRLDSSASDPIGPTGRLVALSARPGRAHQRMLRWASIGIASAALVAVAFGLSLRASASRAEQDAAVWRTNWRDAVGRVYPEALVPQPGRGPLSIIREEVERRERALTPPVNNEPALPVLEELATLSMVLGTSDISIESIDVDSRVSIRVRVICRNVAQAERLAVALGEIDGSWISNWTATYAEVNAPRPGTAAPPTTGDRPIRATFVGTWSDEARARAQGQSIPGTPVPSAGTPGAPGPAGGPR